MASDYKAHRSLECGAICQGKWVKVNQQNLLIALTLNLLNLRIQNTCATGHNNKKKVTKVGFFYDCVQNKLDLAWLHLYALYALYMFLGKTPMITPYREHLFLRPFRTSLASPDSKSFPPTIWMLNIHSSLFFASLASPELKAFLPPRRLFKLDSKAQLG